MGRFDSRRWWTLLPLIPFTTPHNRGLRISAFCGELQKAEFEVNVIRKRTLAGLKAARARGRVGGRPEKLSVRDKQQIRAAAQRPPKFASRTWRSASGSASARCTNRWVPCPGEIDSNHGHSIQGPYHDSRRRRDRRALRPSSVHAR